MFVFRGMALASSALLLLSVQAARAADVQAPAKFDWTGFYAGIDGGYSWDKSRWTNDDPKYSGNHDFFVYDPKGWVAGVHAGYDRQFDNDLVAGLEADVLFGGVKNHSAPFYTGNPPVYSTGYVGTSEINVQSSLRGRLGYAVGRFMPYVTGGLALADYDYGFTQNPTSTYSPSKTLLGWTIGAGLEYAVTDSISLRGQYLYSDFGTFHHGEFKNDQGASGYAAYKVSLRSSTVTAGISVKF